MALILLDSGLIGLAVSEPRGRHPDLDADLRAFKIWHTTTSGIIHEFAVVDVSLYEVERELLRLGATVKLRRLEDFVADTTPIQVTRTIWRRAARLWAEVRRRGMPTAHPEAPDADAILAATALVRSEQGFPSIIATTNVGHLGTLGADARRWRDIPD